MIGSHEKAGVLSRTEYVHVPLFTFHTPTLRQQDQALLPRCASLFVLLLSQHYNVPKGLDTHFRISSPVHYCPTLIPNILLLGIIHPTKKLNNSYCITCGRVDIPKKDSRAFFGIPPPFSYCGCGRDDVSSGHATLQRENQCFCFFPFKSQCTEQTDKKSKNSSKCL